MTHRAGASARGAPAGLPRWRVSVLFAGWWITLALLLVVLFLVLHNAPFVGALFDTLGRSIASAGTLH